MARIVIPMVTKNLNSRSFTILSKDINYLGIVSDRPLITRRLIVLVCLLRLILLCVSENI